MICPRTCRASQSLALAWFVQTDCGSVAVLIESESDDEFVKAPSLKPNGKNEVVVRKRLAKARGAA